MSSPALEINRVRTIPLIVEREYQPMEIEEISGYPFDNSDGDFHSKLDDIAKRHPEFAEHLGGFRKRANSRPSNSTDDPEFRTRFTRPFGERLDRFGFPFNRDDFDDVDAYTQQFHKPQREEFYQQHPTSSQPGGSSTSFYEGNPPSHHQQYQQPEPTSQTDQASYTQTNTDNCQPNQERVRSNIQQSNTTDLSQPQEPINERNQRSMSAPPVDKVQRSSQNTTTSTQSSENDKMSHTEHKSNERIIPIHIEGRDEPVIPRHVPPSSSSFSQPQQHHQAYTAPQPERIFGQRPEHFTQFINREPRQFTDKWAGGFAEEPCRQQRFQTQFASQPPQQQAKEEIPIPVQRPTQAPNKPQEQYQQQQRSASPQPKAQPKPTAPQQNKTLSPIEQIQVIQKEVSALMEKVHQFNGKPKDKEYLYLDEMLTRNLLKLDNIDTQGQDNIRSARKEAVRCIEKTISVLEAKAAAGVNPPQPTQENMDTEEKTQPTETEAANIENKSEQTPTQATADEQQPMETEVQEKKIDTTESMEIVPESPAAMPPVVDEKESANKTDEEVPVENTNENVVNNADQQPSQQVITESTANDDCNESNISVSDAIKKFDVNSDSGKNEEVKPVMEVTVEEQKNEKSDTSTSEVQEQKENEEKKNNKKTKKKVNKKE